MTMSPSVEETRRDFLLRLARTVAFVPPIMASMRVASLEGQGKGAAATPAASDPTTTTSGPGKGKGASNSNSAVLTDGSLSPTAQAVSSPTFNVQQSTAQSPWDAGGSSKPPPWAAPPPTQSGR